MWPSQELVHLCMKNLHLGIFLPVFTYLKRREKFIKFHHKTGKKCLKTRVSNENAISLKFADSARKTFSKKPLKRGIIISIKVGEKPFRF